MDFILRTTKDFKQRRRRSSSSWGKKKVIGSSHFYQLFLERQHFLVYPVLMYTLFKTYKGAKPKPKEIIAAQEPGESPQTKIMVRENDNFWFQLAALSFRAPKGYWWSH